MWMHNISTTQPHASRLDRSKPMAAVHARSCPFQMAWTWCSYGQRYIRLVQLCGSFEVSRNAFSYHTIAALRVFSCQKKSKCFYRSMITCTWLLLSGWNSLTMWKWSRIGMVQILSNLLQTGFWCHVETCCGCRTQSISMPRILPKPTVRTQSFDCAANAADSSPDAQCRNAKQTS